MHTTLHTRFCSIKQIRMICAFTKLHENVQEPHLVTFACSINNINVFHQDFCVPIAIIKRETLVNTLNACRCATVAHMFIHFTLQTSTLGLVGTSMRLDLVCWRLTFHVWSSVWPPRFQVYLFIFSFPEIHDEMNAQTM